MRPVFLALILTGTLATVACSDSHAISVINRSKEDIEDATLTLEKDRASVGWIPPGGQHVYIAAEGIGKEAILDWKMSKKGHHVKVDLSDVPMLFTGTVVLEVQPDATVKKSLEEPIAGLKH